MIGLKIAIVVNSFPKLSESFIINKVVYLKQNGMDVDVIIHNNDISGFKFFEDRFDQGAFNLIRSFFSCNNIISKLFFIFSNLIQLLKAIYKVKSKANLSAKKVFKLVPFLKEDYDLVHFGFSGLAIFYDDILDLIEAKKIMSCRGAAEQLKPLYDKKRREELRDVVEKMDLVHCVSGKMQKEMSKYGLLKHKSFINYPSIDTDYFIRKTPRKPIQGNLIKVLSIGRLHWKKGFNYAIRGINILLEKGYNIQFRIAGDGVEKEHLSFIIDYLNISDSVCLLGNLSGEEIKLELETTDVFLLSSLSEGISNAALEAMSMEVPVVSTISGGMEEAITDKENGVLCELMSPSSIASGVEWVIHNPNEAVECGKKARATIETKFTLQRQAEVFLNNYKSII